MARQLAFVLLGLFISANVVAADYSDEIMNKLVLRLNAEQWVTSKTALVTMAINASVSDNDLDKIQDEVLKKLANISNKGEWHLVSFDRSLDQSGLEKIQMMAQIRLLTSDMVGLRDKAKAISKPGETFTLDNVAFTPNTDELRAANTALRSDIYQQAKDEMDRANRMFPNQKYFIHKINFNESFDRLPVPQNAMMSMVKVGGANNSTPLAIGDKLTINADVVLASMPNATLIKNIV